jgi:hypothetical protein
VWKSNKKAWVTAALMEEWLKVFNERMKQQKRRILLFLDAIHILNYPVYGLHGFHLT